VKLLFASLNLKGRLGISESLLLPTNYPAKNSVYPTIKRKSSSASHLKRVGRFKIDIAGTHLGV